jgi:hypothetical protein
VSEPRTAEELEAWRRTIVYGARWGKFAFSRLFDTIDAQALEAERLRHVLEAEHEGWCPCADGCQCGATRSALAGTEAQG